jgi:hypothetical protein
VQCVSGKYFEKIIQSRAMLSQIWPANTQDAGIPEGLNSNAIARGGGEPSRAHCDL